MKATDLQEVEGSFTNTVKEYKDIGLTDPDKAKYLAIMQKEASILSNEEKRNNDLDFQKERFALDKDHTYFQETLEKDKLKQQKEAFEYQKNKDINDLELQKVRVELEKQRLAFEKADLEARRAQERNESKYRWITFGITTGLAFIQFAVSIVVYRKLAYTNLKLIYRDEGRPTTDYKDAIKDVKNLLK